MVGTRTCHHEKQACKLVSNWLPSISNFVPIEFLWYSQYRYLMITTLLLVTHSFYGINHLILPCQFRLVRNPHTSPIILFSHPVLSSCSLILFSHSVLSSCFLILFSHHPDRSDGLVIGYMTAGFVLKFVFVSAISLEATMLHMAAERRLHESRRQLINYIFHEVRVPLNTLTMGISVLKRYIYKNHKLF